MFEDVTQMNHVVCALWKWNGLNWTAHDVDTVPLSYVRCDVLRHVDSRDAPSFRRGVREKFAMAYADFQQAAAPMNGFDGSQAVLEAAVKRRFGGKHHSCVTVCLKVVILVYAVERGWNAIDVRQAALPATHDLRLERRSDHGGRPRQNRVRL
jgi:hypothetical protein